MITTLKEINQFNFIGLLIFFSTSLLSVLAIEMTCRGLIDFAQLLKNSINLWKKKFLEKYKIRPENEISISALKTCQVKLMQSLGIKICCALVVGMATLNPISALVGSILYMIYASQTLKKPFICWTTQATGISIRNFIHLGSKIVSFIRRNGFKQR